MGADIGGLAEMALTLSYSRQFEAEADQGAVELLRGAGIATASFAAFFDRLGKAMPSGQVIALLSTHPAPQERSVIMRRPVAGAVRPALDKNDWQALKAICRTTM
jgi:beta-barrel assembly-enhancing protease